jgi:5'-AMP-activated protein kinase regulatory gamma subunit
MSTSKQLFVQHFQSKTIEQLVGQQREIVILEADEPIKQVIRKLQEKDIRSAPVHVEDKKVFVDFIDIVAYIVDTFRQIDQNSTNIHTSTIDDRNVQESILNTPAHKVANYSKQDAYSTLPLSATVYDAAAELSKGNKRVVVEDDGRNFVNIVTHSDVMNLMKQCIDEKGAQNFTSTVGDLGISTPLDGIVTEDMRAIDAFVMMRNNQDSFVRVVNEDNNLISVISARDIQVLSLSEEGFKMLHLPVLDFLSAVRQLSPVDKYPFIFCLQNSTIDLVVKRLKATRVNRLMLINDEKVPIGIVSVSNLAQYISKQ